MYGNEIMDDIVALGQRFNKSYYVDIDVSTTIALVRLVLVPGRPTIYRLAAPATPSLCF